MMARKSICHIIYRLDYGGLENGLVNVINQLPDDKYAHTIISLKPVTDFRKRLTANNVEVYDLDKRDGKDFGAYRRGWKLLRSIKPDVVHTRNLPTIDFLLLAYLSGVRSLIHSEHGLDLVESDNNALRYKLLRRSLALLPVRYVAVSRDLQEWLCSEIGIRRRQVSTIYNGVDSSLFNSKDGRRNLSNSEHRQKRAFVIGHVGRFAPIKNQLLLVRAFCLLLERHPHLRECVRLSMIGDGPLKKECEQLLADASASDIAWLPGFVSDMPDVYQTFDLFVLPSIREGISNTLLEAMACGLPVVATDVGGTPEIVLDGHTGTLVESENVEAVADAIMNYVSDSALVRKNGRNARLHIESNFSLTRMTEQYDELYDLA
jgi:sugar transferase (PEP-CTERM/EpsH1 system associated)